MLSASMTRIPHLTQWLAAFQVFLIMAVVGSNIGWTAPLMGRLVLDNPPFRATDEQISWVASLLSFFRPVGTLLGAVSSHYFGTKITLHFTIPIYSIISAVAIISANIIEHVYITQIFAGLAVGASYCINTLYIAEIASDSIRGALSSIVMQGLLAGVVFGNAIGAYLEPWIYGVIVISFNIIYLATFFYFPETPYEFIVRKKPEKAVQALKWYQDDVNAEENIKELTRFLNSKPKLQIGTVLKELFVSPVNRKVMIILFIAYGLIQFSGVYTILEYSNIIFINAKVDVIKPATLVIILSAFMIPGSWVAVYASDRIGRTILLCSSCMIYTLASIFVGVNFQLIDMGYENSNIQWFVIISGSLFRTSFSVGIVGVPMILISELLAPNVKNVAACILNVFSAYCSFISNKMFQKTVSLITYHYTFYMLALFTFLLGIYVITCIPETKGKTMEEIQDMLAKSVNNKKVKKNSNGKFDVTRV